MEPVVWTAPDTKVRGDAEDAPTASQSMVQSLKAAKASVIEPSEKEFVSQVQQATRKGEKSYHVKAFRGSKDGEPRITVTELTFPSRANDSYRLPLLPVHRHLLRLQEAATLLLRRYRVHFLHLRPAADLQPCRRRLAPRRQRRGRADGARILDDRPGRLCRH